MAFAIESLDLVKQYAGSPALRGVSLSVTPGELFGLVGPDGAGKTTFLRILSGLLSFDSGQVCIDGIDVASNPAAVKERIGYMSQRFSLSETLTVAENLLYVSEVWHVPPGERRKRVTRLLQFSRLDPFQSRLARNLSGGMKQKLALMCTLLHRPQILFLDEPTNGVDPVSRRDFWAILYQLLKDGITILMTTAYLDEAERCNRVGLMHRGRLIRCDAPEVLKHEAGASNMEGVFIKTVRAAEAPEA